MNYYRIEQNCGGNWGPVPEGEYETQESAIAGMRSLEQDLGWNRLRVVEVQQVGRHLTTIGVIENGV